MCGIVGMVHKEGTFSSHHEEFFEDLLYLDGIRGTDSTGVFTVDSKNEVAVHKQAVSPEIFLKTTSWEAFKKKNFNKSRIVVGHNRKSTVGNSTTKNAHPFIDKGIVLVHNGYIANHKELDSTKEVDSETIITALRSEDNYLNGLEKLFGAFAIVWYDHRKEKLFLTRNNERPLWICHNMSHFFFSSEPDPLVWRLKHHMMAHQDPIPVQAGRVIEINLKPFEIVGTQIPVKPKPTVVVDATWSPKADNDGEEGPVQVETKKVPISQSDSDVMKVVKQIMNDYPQGKKVYFTPKAFVSYKDATHCMGVAWFPGSAPCNAIWCIQDKKDLINVNVDYSQEAPLIGYVTAVVRRNNEVRLTIERVRYASEHFKDYNGQRLGGDELKETCKNLICHSCGGELNRLRSEVTEFNRADGYYDPKCDECVTKGNSGNRAKEVAAEMEQAAERHLRDVMAGSSGGPEGG